MSLMITNSFKPFEKSGHDVGSWIIEIKNLQYVLTMLIDCVLNHSSIVHVCFGGSFRTLPYILNYAS